MRIELSNYFMNDYIDNGNGVIFNNINEKDLEFIIELAKKNNLLLIIDNTKMEN